MNPPSVVLGVGGGIAAYKAATLLRLFTEGGARVRVVPTQAALQFVGEATWAALSGQPVAAEVWSDVHEVPHVQLGRSADLVVVAPATADLLARAAHGLADDLLTATLLTARCPVVMAPAMHTEMWQHPATQANVALLRHRGVHVLEPATGRLTGSDSGPGRLMEPAEIHAAALRLMREHADDPGGAGTGEPGEVDVEPFRHDLAGRRVVVSAGGTREPLDPVRFLGNASSGRQGVALATSARDRGAHVTLVAAHTEVPDPEGVDLVRVSTARELREAVLSAARAADAVVMAAAVADFRPASAATSKIKKGDDGGVPVVELIRNPDVLADLVESRRQGGLAASAVLVGFAAETGDASGSVLDHGRAKLERKGADLLVVNEVGGGLAFGTPDNTVVILRAAASGGEPGAEQHVGPAPKEEVAHAVWDAVGELWSWRDRHGSRSRPDAPALASGLPPT